MPWPAVGSRSCLSITPASKGVAIPVPGDLIGNSSSSGMGIGADILPLMDDAVLAREGPDGLYSLLIATTVDAVENARGSKKKENEVFVEKTVA